MKRSINTAAINKTSYDSTYVGVLSYHVIQMKEKGTYNGYVVYKENVIDQVTINVLDNHDDMQANIDFNVFKKHHSKGRGTLGYNLKTGGCLLLMNSTGNNQFRFRVEKIGKKRGAGIFSDTKKLSSGELYACTLLRPGSYDLLYNGKKTGSIEVEYPTLKTKKTNLSEAVRVQMTPKGLKDKKISVLPMQGLVFEMEDSGRIQIELKREEKCRGLVYHKAKPLKKRAKTKSNKPLKTYRWENPKYSQAKK